MANPVKQVEGGARSLMSYVRAHPVAFIAGGMLFAAFVFPWIARQLGVLKAKGGFWDKIIPAALTRSA